MLFKLLRFVTVTLSLGQALAEVKMKGVNIAGFDFGCIIDVSFLPEDSFPTANRCRALVMGAIRLRPFCHPGNGCYLGSPSPPTTRTGSAKCSIFPVRTGSTYIGFPWGGHFS